MHHRTPLRQNRRRGITPRRHSPSLIIIVVEVILVIEEIIILVAEVVLVVFFVFVFVFFLVFFLFLEVVFVLFFIEVVVVLIFVFVLVLVLILIIIVIGILVAEVVFLTEVIIVVVEFKVFVFVLVSVEQCWGCATERGLPRCGEELGIDAIVVKHGVHVPDAVLKQFCVGSDASLMHRETTRRGPTRACSLSLMNFQTYLSPVAVLSQSV